MYFWKDDFALMIKAQNPEEAVGFFGPGIKGDGAYRYITIPFSLLYPSLGLNAFLYFLTGIILYFFASISVFYLAEEIFQERLKSFLTALIFTSGYIGADSIYGLTNSYQTSWVIMLLCLSLVYFIKSFKTGYIAHYLFSMFLFAASLETGYIRAHGFFLIIASSVILVINFFSIKRILEIVFKIVPFFLLFRFFYLTSTPAQVGNSQLAKSLQSGDYNYFYNPLITFINVFLPTPLINSSLSLWNNLLGKQTTLLKFQLILFVIFSFILLIFLSYLQLKKYFKEPENLKLLQVVIFSLGTIAGSFIGVFYIGAASTYLESTHRYLSVTLIGLAFFWVSFFNLLLSRFKKTNLFLTVIILLISLSYLILVNSYAVESINFRTTPQKQFFSQLKNEIPQITDKTFLYFDVSNKNNSNGKFGNIFGAGSVGGSAEITMHYPGIDRYFVVTSISDFQDFVNKFKKEGGSINNSFWFYFADNKLINRTLHFRNILSVGKTTPLNLSTYNHETKLISKDGKLISENTSFEMSLPPEVLSLTDGILKFSLLVTPVESTQSAQSTDEKDEIYLKYLLSKTKIKSESKATVLNHFQNFIAENLFDSKIETSWMANRGPWHNLTNGITDQIQFIDISLETPVNLGGILFTNGHSLRTPTKYKIFTKNNGQWQEIKNVENGIGKQTNEVWFEKLPNKVINEVRIELLDSSSHDAPQISEIELVEGQYAALDFKKAQQIETDPSLLLSQNPNSSLVRNYFAQNGKLSFLYKSNKDNDFNVPIINFNIKGLNKTFTYEIPIPANGLELEKIKFLNLNFPAKYIFSDFEFINPPLSYYLNNS